MATNVDKLQLQGTKREEALARAAEQIAAWGLVMPQVEPLVMDFGSHDFDRYGLTEYWAANELEAGYCGKFMFLFDGQTCPLHSHHAKHETFFIVKGQVRLAVNGVEQVLAAGEVMSLGTDEVHTFTGIGNALILELSMPCVPKDTQFRDRWARDWLENGLG